MAAAQDSDVRHQWEQTKKNIGVRTKNKVELHTSKQLKIQYVHDKKY